MDQNKEKYEKKIVPKEVVIIERYNVSRLTYSASW